jgi:hypothetical protein
MRFFRAPLALAVLIALLAPALPAQEAVAPAVTPAEPSRWESNLSGGWVSNGRIGLVKSF